MACWQRGNNGLLNVGADVTSNQRGSPMSPHSILLSRSPHNSVQSLKYNTISEFWLLVTAQTIVSSLEFLLPHVKIIFIHSKSTNDVYIWGNITRLEC